MPLCTEPLRRLRFPESRMQPVAQNLLVEADRCVLGCLGTKYRPQGVWWGWINIQLRARSRATTLPPGLRPSFYLH